MKTILTVFGTRPEVIKLAPVLERLNSADWCHSIVVSTAQHRQMVDDLLGLFSITPTYDLDIMSKNQSLTDISVRAMSGLSPLLSEIRPDMILVQGDTTTAFISALCAFYNKIPVGHVEAGLRSYDPMHPFPEEINRRLISSLGNLHFVPTSRNADNLKKEGVSYENVYVTGNTVIDSLLKVASRARGTLTRYLPAKILENRLVLVTAHRRENWGEPLENLCHALLELSRSYPDLVLVYPMHMNPKVRNTVMKILSGQERVFLIEPLPYEPFVEAMVNSHFIITDSGGIQEEAPSLQKPVLVFRKVTERPEGLDTGGVKLVGLSKETVLNEASALLDDPLSYRKMIADHNPYGDGLAAKRIVDAILYYFGWGERPGDFAPALR